MRNTNKRWALAAVLLSLSLVALACGDDKTTSSSSGNTTTTVKDKKTLIGFQGTTPFGKLDTLKQRLMEINPDLIDFNYGPESYDAVVIAALAAEAAQDDGIASAAQINPVTRNGEKCTDFKSCKALLDQKKDIDYETASGQDDFSGNGQPTKASYGLLGFTNTGCKATKECIDFDNIKYELAQVPTSEDVPQVDPVGTRKGDGVLTIGTLLPETGDLAFLGPPEFAGVELAIKDINEAGGVLGKDVVYIKGDSGDNKNNKWQTTVPTLLQQNVDVVIGAASSGVTKNFLKDVTAAGVTIISPANTSPSLSFPACLPPGETAGTDKCPDDKGLYFRTAPSDILQGEVLAKFIVKDGYKNVAIIARNDDYGTGLADQVEKQLTDSGGKVAEKKIYAIDATDFSAEVAAAKAADPDAIIVIGFEESSKILAKMVEQGVGPADKPVYGTDGNIGNGLAQTFEAGK